MYFRYDINALRAIAVIAVVTFHFNPLWLPGGFTGVDIFFVISGFLMTRIIFRGLENNTFSLFGFYIARARRIIPALTVLCTILLIFGFLYLPPIEYKELSKHIISSMIFISNIVYCNEAGYFDTASNEKWMLHTWSLSVEWQFYIIYPVIVIVLKKLLSLKNLKRSITIGCVFSFVISIIATIKWPDFAYFLLPTRAWEMMVGGIAFLYPSFFSDTQKKYLSITGFSLILASLLLISSDTPWPGHFSLIPVLGTYLVIIANINSNFISKNSIIQFIGTHSYTIYLWHWPVVVFFNYYNNNQLILAYIILSIFLGVIFGILDNSHHKRKLYFTIFIITISTSSIVFLEHGLLSRVPIEFQVTKQQFRNKYEGHAGLWDDNGVFINSNNDNFDYVLIGNSFARHYNSFFLDNGIKVVNLAVDGCLSTKRNYTHYKNSLVCEDRYQFLLNFVKEHPGKNLIFSSSWSHYNCKTRRNGFSCDNEENILADEMRSLVNDVSPYVSNIYIIGRTQGSLVIPFKYLAESYLPGYRFIRNDIKNKKQARKDIEVNRELRKLSSEIGYTYIDPTGALCTNTNCYVIKDGQPLYTDHGHLTKAGANIIGSYLMDKITSSL